MGYIGTSLGVGIGPYEMLPRKKALSGAVWRSFWSEFAWSVFWAGRSAEYATRRTLLVSLHLQQRHYSLFDREGLRAPDLWTRILWVGLLDCDGH
jgi:hypothetical protein